MRNHNCRAIKDVECTSASLKEFELNRSQYEIDRFKFGLVSLKNDLLRDCYKSVRYVVS